MTYAISQRLSARAFVFIAVSILFFAASTVYAAIINGTSGNDTLNGTSVADTIKGYAGADTINGAGGSDYLYGGDGNDTIRGDGILLVGLSGNDKLYGEKGNDYLDGDAKNDYLYGGPGADTLVMGYDSTTGEYAHGGTGADTFNITDGEGTLTIDYAERNINEKIISNDSLATIDRNGDGYIGLSSGIADRITATGTTADGKWFMKFNLPGGGNLTIKSSSSSSFRLKKVNNYTWLIVS